jgi:hypothetical protein
MVGKKKEKPKNQKTKNKKQFLLYKSSVCFFLRWIVGIQSCVNISLTFSELLRALLGLRWTHRTCCHLQNPKLCSDVGEFCPQNPKCCSIVGEFCLRYSTSTYGIDETKEKFVALMVSVHFLWFPLCSGDWNFVRSPHLSIFARDSQLHFACLHVTGPLAASTLMFFHSSPEKSHQGKLLLCQLSLG